MKALPNSKAFSCVCCSLTQLLPAIAAEARKQPLKEAGAGVRLRQSAPEKCVEGREMCPREMEQHLDLPFIL